MPAPAVAAKLTTLQAASVAKPIFTDVPCWGLNQRSFGLRCPSPPPSFPLPSSELFQLQPASAGTRPRPGSVSQSQHRAKLVPHLDCVRVDLVDRQHVLRPRTKTSIRLLGHSNGTCLLFCSVLAPAASAIRPAFQLRLRRAGGRGVQSSAVQGPRA